MPQSSGLTMLILLIGIHIFAAAVANFVGPQIPLAPGYLPGTPQPYTPTKKPGEFRLTNVFHHGTNQYPQLHRRKRIPLDATIYMTDENGGKSETCNSFVARSRPLRIQRLKNRSQDHLASLLEAKWKTGRPLTVSASDWTVDQIPGPNISDKETLLTLARAAGNAYIEEPDTGEWQDVEGGFNYTEDFGWESDGLRGHIFADEANTTVIIGLKGTSMAVFDGAGTTTQDKINDNLFFGCCCGQGTSWWSKPACDCQTDTLTCNNTCVAEAIRGKNKYFYAAQDLYYNVTELYPNAEIWLIGHSLGGATCSLLGMTMGNPVVTFESPGDAMAAKRLGLPTPPGYNLSTLADEEPPSQGVYHFGHTADPLFMGVCNGPNSFCSIGGYAMESLCHTNLECVYDTVKDKGWGLHIVNHKIQTVISGVIEAYNDTAECKVVEDCTDCASWKYFEGHSSTTSTSSAAETSTKYSATRTSTCETPGWWGCLDEPTTSTVTTPTTTRTVTTGTCLDPGWFGCRNSTTIIYTTTEPAPPPSTSSAPVTTTTSSDSPSSMTCGTPGFFWGCKDQPAAYPGVVLKSTSLPLETSSRKGRS
ncbi:MAG: putative lipase atg15 [Alyxoria varia]|nr:MAG: putative lipase atg15 [Alyxoria varia]